MIDDGLMKNPSQRTKVVIRHLPPTLVQDHLLSQILKLLPGRYNWFTFCPGNASQKRQKCSRAYIDFKSPEDVFRFSEFFNGHVFVNEKGSQFKVTVEYAPSQRVPKLSSKKNGREGTIYKDPDYLEFLKTIAKPAENLLRPEVNLEIKEAEQSGSVNENPIITPLMEFVRQKRASESGSQVPFHIRKLSKRYAASNTKFGSNATKSISGKKKRSSKNQSGNDKSSPIKFSKKEYQPRSSTVRETTEHEKGITSTTNSGEKKILLLKSREQEIPQATSQLLDGTSSGSSPASVSLRRRQNEDVSRKLIKDILLSNESRQSQAQRGDQQPKSSDNVNLKAGTIVQSDAKFDSSKCGPSSFDSYNLRKDDQHIRKDFKGFVTPSKKHEKDPKNRGRQDHGVRSLHHTIISQATQENSSSTVSQFNKLLSPDTVNQAAMKNDAPFCEKMNMSSAKNGLKMHSSHQEMGKKSGSSTVGEGKFSRKRFPFGSVSQKQVWIQKSSEAS